MIHVCDPYALRVNPKKRVRSHKQLHISVMPNKSKLKKRERKKEELEQYSIVTEDDMSHERDTEAQLIGQLQEKLEMSREEIKQILQKL